jgi:hypothetical protein
MKRTYAVLLTLVILATVTFWSQPTRPQAQGGVSGTLGLNSNQTQIAGAPVNNDPCGSWGVVKQSVPVAITTATTTQLVALSAGQTVFVCGFTFAMTGTTPTFQFEYGTGASCGTGTTVLTGAFQNDIATGFGQYIYGGGEMTIFAAASANALCIVSAGTPTINGVVTFVQRVAGT